MLGLYQEKYFDFNVRHFHEKLREEHGLRLSYTWVKLALQGAGLVNKRRKRGVHRQRRPRRPLPGMLLHLDGSQHQWFVDDRWYDLLVVLDDASSEIYYAQLVEQESTRTVLAALREVVEQQGVFCALYSDRASHFFLTRKAGEPVDRQRPTQVGRALRELGIQMIPAYLPQARGRGERNFGTWQGRLPSRVAICGRLLRSRQRMGSCGRAISGSSIGRLCRAERPTGQRLFAASQTGVRPHLLDPARTGGESGQYWSVWRTAWLQIEKTPWRWTLAGLPADRL